MFCKPQDRKKERKTKSAKKERSLIAQSQKKLKLILKIKTIKVKRKTFVTM